MCPQNKTNNHSGTGPLALSFVSTFENYMPEALRPRVIPLFEKLDKALNGDDAEARSLRMALMVFLIRVFNAAIAFISQVLLARWMGSFDYGIFVAVWAALISMSNIAALGMPTASVRFIAKYREEADHERLWGFFYTGIGLPFCLSILVMIAGIIGIVNFPDLINPYYLMPIYIAILCLPVGVVVDVAETAGRPFNWVSVSFLPSYVFRPILILLAISVCVLFGIEANATVAMWCGFIAINIVGITQIAALFRKMRNTVPDAKPKFEVPYWLKMSLPIFLLEGFFNLQSSADVLLVSILTNPESAGIYYAAAKILALVHFAGFAVRTAVAHNFSAYHTAGNMAGLGIHLRHAIKMSFIPTFAFALFLVIFGKYLLMLFGDEFISGSNVIWILAIGIIIRSMVGPAEAILVMTGHQKTCALVYATSLTTNICLNLILIPQFGIQGAAVATACATICESAALYYFVRKRLNLDSFIIKTFSPKSD